MERHEQAVDAMTPAYRAGLTMAFTVSIHERTSNHERMSNKSYCLDPSEMRPHRYRNKRHYREHEIQWDRRCWHLCQCHVLHKLSRGGHIRQLRRLQYTRVQGSRLDPVCLSSQRHAPGSPSCPLFTGCEICTDPATGYYGERSDCLNNSKTSITAPICG